MDNQQEKGWSNKDSFNLLSLTAYVGAAFITPWTRRYGGKEYPGLAGLLALLILAFFIAATQDLYLTYFGCCWLIFLIGQRIECRLRAKKGIITHSRFSGQPELVMKLLPFIKHESTAKVTEIVFVFLAGIALYQVSEPLACFFFAGASGLFIVAIIDEHCNQLQVTRANDARIEAESFQHQMRN